MGQARQRLREALQQRDSAVSQLLALRQQVREMAPILQAATDLVLQAPGRMISVGRTRYVIDRGGGSVKVESRTIGEQTVLRALVEYNDGSVDPASEWPDPAVAVPPATGA